MEGRITIQMDPKLLHNICRPSWGGHEIYLLEHWLQDASESAWRLLWSGQYDLARSCKEVRGIIRVREIQESSDGGRGKVTDVSDYLFSLRTRNLSPT